MGRLSKFGSLHNTILHLEIREPLGLTDPRDSRRLTAAPMDSPSPGELMVERQQGEITLSRAFVLFQPVLPT
jgi:hypothetical protein